MGCMPSAKTSSNSPDNKPVSHPARTNLYKDTSAAVQSANFPPPSIASVPEEAKDVPASFFERATSTPSLQGEVRSPSNPSMDLRRRQNGEPLSYTNNDLVQREVESSVESDSFSEDDQWLGGNQHYHNEIFYLSYDSSDSSSSSYFYSASELELHKENVAKALKVSNGIEGKDGLEEFRCKICYTNLVQVIMLPCRHTLCYHCAEKVDRCPYDRTEITEKRRFSVRKGEELVSNNN